MFRIKHHEFWNTHLFHFPLYLYWIYLSVKARSPFFFSAANPGIENGGLIGESKYDILKKINPVYLPKTLYFQKTGSVDDVLKVISGNDISFPFMVKPDIGQGGWLIDLIETESDLASFLQMIKIPFIVQEYIAEPLEVGLLYYRFPGETKGKISSLAFKDLLSVTGDGIQSIRELMKAKYRAKKHLQRLDLTKKFDLNRIPLTGERVPLSVIGNHSYGTTFFDANHLIDEDLTRLFDSLCMEIEGFYFGRFDIRCNSLEALKSGNFKILELNGVGSEPLHIFDPKTKFIDAYKSAFRHWEIIYEISRLNRKNKLQLMKLKEAVDTYRNIVRIQRLHQTSISIGN